jgi:Kef-type K+ transport system membrane component KefB/nucleotide-binding universal stress UspA family protein
MSPLRIGTGGVESCARAGEEANSVASAAAAATTAVVMGTLTDWYDTIAIRSLPVVVHALSRVASRGFGDAFPVCYGAAARIRRRHHRNTMDKANLLLLVLLQIAVILAASRLMGVLFARLRQPQVVGEMLAGILLGPTLLGAIVHPNPLFPPESVQHLEILSQLGVVLFLFLVGLEFDPKLVQGRGKAAAFISGSSVVLPLGMGIALTYLIQHLFDDEHRAHLLPSALFMGAAISVTAFPVLARILAERNLARTRVGALSITAAAVNDVLAWVMLAVVVAVSGNGDAESSGPWAPLWKLLLASGYIAVMLLVVRPGLRRVEAVYDRQGRLSQNLVAVIFLLLLASSFATEWIGVHALFGAFVAGCVMPKRSAFVHHLGEKLEDFTVVFLLPIFFAAAGLKTDLTNAFSGEFVGYTLLIIAVACVGKMIGAGVPALLCGNSVRDSAAVGVLMNTRGLMELIILTVGLQLGVINETIYGMMVIMALVTTAMTAPLLQWVLPPELMHPATPPAESERRKYSILVPVARPDSGGPLARMASLIAGSDRAKARIAALHLERPVDREAYRTTIDDPAAAPAEQTEELAPLVEAARDEAFPVETLRFVSRDIPSDIARVARIQDVDLILMGFHNPVLGRNILGGTVHRVLTGSDCDVAVFVDRDFDEIRRILVPYHGSTHDKLALDVAGRVARSSGASITILHVVPESDAGKLDAAGQVERSYTDPALRAQVTLKVARDDSPIDAVLRETRGGYDLVVVGVEESWGLESHLFGFRSERIASECDLPLLLVRKLDLPMPAAPSPVPENR